MIKKEIENNFSLKIIKYDNMFQHYIMTAAEFIAIINYRKINDFENELINLLNKYSEDVSSAKFKTESIIKPEQKF